MTLIKSFWLASVTISHKPCYTTLLEPVGGEV